MNEERILAGLDTGHINTKVIIVKGTEILGHGMAPTGFDVLAAAQAALNDASNHAGISLDELDGIVATGIFRGMATAPPLNAAQTVPDYMADARGALFLNKNSRTVIDMGGNVQKVISYDENGNLLDVSQNEKCADGLGIFYTTMARTLGLTEQELSELALQSTHNLSVAVQCAISAESDAIDLLCQGKDLADVADAVSRFVVERIADMCTYMSLPKEIVVAGGLAKYPALTRHLPGLIEQGVTVLNLPEYVGAIGAVMSYEGEK
jgi:predicted CoA-substrate-specific enzyme activase